MMLVQAVESILLRDLRALARELEAYPDERQLWQPVPGLSNPGGTLALHLTGNIQHYLGAILGGSDYVRDRPAEFSRRDVPRAELLAEVSAASEAVKRAAARLTPSRLTSDFPEQFGGVVVGTAEYLVHLVAHFTYHLGQLDYHRRVVTGMEASVAPVLLAELSTARPASGAR